MGRILCAFDALAVLAAEYALSRAQARFDLGQLAGAAADLDGFREKYV